MASMSPNTADFLPQFKAIGQSLKKRFFRKPNVADAVEQYENLCQELEREGQNEFAGICALEAAKCQEALQNNLEQANMLVKSSRLLLEARESQNWLTAQGCSISSSQISSQANLQLGIQCLRQAAKVYRLQGSMGIALMLILKMGETLYREKEYGEALKLYKDALGIASTHFNLADQLVIIECIVKCKLKVSELESAYKTVCDYLTKLSKCTDETLLKSELFNTFSMRFETMRVSLILIIGTDTADLAKFIWPESPMADSCGDGEENNPENDRAQTMMYLKSLVLAVQHGSVNEINVVRDHLAPDLTETEHELFLVLIQLQS